VENTLIVGEWRNSLDAGELQLIEEIDVMRDSGYRLLPYRSTVARLMDLLDGYDAITSSFLHEENPAPTVVESPASYLKPKAKARK
jgi:hypothetical protein